MSSTITAHLSLWQDDVEHKKARGAELEYESLKVKPFELRITRANSVGEIWSTWCVRGRMHSVGKRNEVPLS